MSKYFAPQRRMLYRCRAVSMSHGTASAESLISNFVNERTIRRRVGISIGAVKNFLSRRSMVRCHFSRMRAFEALLVFKNLISFAHGQRCSLQNRSALRPFAAH